MPSGSRSRSGGGGHFGSSSRSSSSRSSWGGGGSSWGRGPRHYHHGTHVHVHSRGSFLAPFIAFAMFFIFIGIMCFAFPVDIEALKRKKGLIEADFAYYQKLVTDAKEDSSLQINAKVKDVWYDEDYDAYYITYWFTIGTKTYGLADNDEHYTFHIYKHDPSTHSDPIGNGDPYDLYPIDSGDTFPIAINTRDTNSSVDSVNMDYEHTTLEHDYQYKDLCGRINNPHHQTIVGVVATCIGVTIITIGIVLAVKRAKNQKAEEIANSGNPAAAAAGVAPTPKENKCDYCGCVIKAGETSCRRCGAARKR